jgi:phosphoglycolate phosphatase
MTLASKQHVLEILKSFDVVLFDCDGVLYQSETILDGTREAFRLLKDAGIQRRIITNSSSKSQITLCDKLRGMGITDISESDCFPSSVCVAEYISSELLHVKRVYVIGGKGLLSELQKKGLETIGGPDEDEEVMTDHRFVQIGESLGDALVDAVVVGYDTRFNYYKLAYASICFQKNPNCILIGTNDDMHDRIGGRWLIPVNGCALAAVTAAVNGLDNTSGRIEPIIIGKPNKIFGQMVLNNSGLSQVDPSRVLMIGDKLETDIRLAKNCGFRSCLVLSGCATVLDLNSAAEADRPDYVLNGLSDFLQITRH